MGLFSSLSSWLGVKKREVQILMIGLDNSGKSTILNSLKSADDRVEIVPTIGFNVERFNTKTLNFVTFDMSGQGKYRNLWSQYYRGADGLIFVVDGTDRLRIAVSKDELWRLLDHQDITNRNVPLLVFANKMDEKGTLSASEINQVLGLDLIRGRNWHICASCAITGQGLSNGLDWLAGNICQRLESGSK